MILQHTGFNFGEEEYVEDVTKIGKSVLTIMTYKIIDGKLIEKLSYENKRKMDNQETHIDL